MTDVKKQVEHPAIGPEEKLEWGSTVSFHPMPPTLQGLTSEEIGKLENLLVRKLDIRLMPMLVLIYIMNYLDRNAIAAAKLSGITEELGLTSVQFQQNIQDLREHSICRPGCMATLSAWYTRKELSLRTAILYCGSLLSGAFSGLIAAGINDGMNGVRGLLAWRWLFIIEGSITVFFAFAAYFVLPNFPHNSTCITEQQRELAIWRLAKDIREDEWECEEKPILMGGFKECINDSKTWFLVVLNLGAVSSGTINSFFPTVVEGLGESRIHTLLLTVPPYILSCIVAMAVSRNADRTGERYFHFTLPLWVSIAGFIISAATTKFGPRYFAMMVMLPGVYTAFIIGISWVANTLPRPSSKRAAALALTNAIANCSSIYSPYLYPDSGAPRFVLAMSVNAGTSLLAIFTATVFRFILRRLNRELGRAELDGGNDGGFRYLL
ncbi:unnamed protein product [Penicillium pancosmium]